MLGRLAVSPMLGLNLLVSLLPINKTFAIRPFPELLVLGESLVVHNILFVRLSVSQRIQDDFVVTYCYKYRTFYHFSTKKSSLAWD